MSVMVGLPVGVFWLWLRIEASWAAGATASYPGRRRRCGPRPPSLAVGPAGLYFLWVVRGVYRDSLRDWNHATAPRRRARRPGLSLPASALKPLAAAAEKGGKGRGYPPERSVR
ncbi:MAG: hypothetical protein M3Q48_08230 [Actinomycetota bacterium]|nr:hypothetical protein [Actinomycetota bacterium]